MIMSQQLCQSASGLATRKFVNDDDDIPIPQAAALTQKVAAAAGDNFRQLEGYDCAQPREVYDITLGEVRDCNKKQKAVTMVNVTYQLVQEEETTRFKGLKCTVIRTRTVDFCGNADHKTSAATENEFEHSLSPTIDQCRLWHRALKYTDPTGATHDLKLHQRTIIRYYEKGRDYVSSNQVSCKGENHRIKGVIVPEVVVAVHLKITLEAERFVQAEDELLAATSQIHLPCTKHEDGCQTADGTFAWHLEEGYCNIAVMRENVHGAEVTTDKGEIVFMSNDGSLVRLIRKGTRTACGRIIYITNYPGVYLHADLTLQPFHRKVDPAEFKLASFTANLNDYLYATISERLEDETNFSLRHDCEAQAKAAKQQYWAQWREPGLVTFLLEPGVFASSSGEVLYHYRCRPLVVRAIDTNRCYQALPVQTVDNDIHNVAADSKMDAFQPTLYQPETGEGRPMLFLEPITHRLSRFGIAVPCSGRFQSKYRNKQGDWIMATPAIHRAPAPKLTDLRDKERARESPKEISWSEGGIYNQQEVDSIERSLEFSRARMALGSKLTEQAIHFDPNGSIGPGHLFPDVPTFAQMTTGFLAKILSFIHYTGETCAVFLVALFVSRALMTLAGGCFRGWFIHKEHGCGRQLVWLFVPDWMIFRRYHRDRKRRRREKTPADDDSGHYMELSARAKSADHSSRRRRRSPMGDSCKRTHSESPGPRRQVMLTETAPAAWTMAFNRNRRAEDQYDNPNWGPVDRVPLPRGREIDYNNVHANITEVHAAATAAAAAGTAASAAAAAFSPPVAPARPATAELPERLYPLAGLAPDS